MNEMRALRVVVLISGSGSNLQAIMDACNNTDSGAAVCAVLSNKASAYGLQRAADNGIATAVVDHTLFGSRAEFDQALREQIDAFAPDLVVLAGFMRILTPEFVTHYLGRMINIHPSLLPKYPGLHTHRRALEAGDSEHGATVHFVTAELDGGPAIVQAKVAVLPGDTEETLASRVLEREHRLYPLAVDVFAQRRLTLREGVAYLDDSALSGTGIALEQLEAIARRRPS